MFEKSINAFLPQRAMNWLVVSHVPQDKIDNLQLNLYILLRSRIIIEEAEHKNDYDGIYAEFSIEFNPRNITPSSFVYGDKTLDKMFDVPEDMQEHEFVSESTNGAIKLYISEAKRVCYFWLNDISDKRLFHLMQVFIPQALPWYFKYKPSTPQERELLTAMLSEKPADYFKVLMRYSYLRKDYEAQQVAECGTFGVARRIEDYMHAIENTQSSISDLEHSLREQKIELKRQSDVLASLQMQEQGTEQAIVDYIAGMDNIFLVNASKDLDNNFVYVVLGELDQFDPDAYESVNSTTAFERICGNDEKGAEAKLLCDAIFRDRKYKIKTMGWYIVNSEGKLSVYAKGTLPPSYKTTFQFLMEDRLPNPHFWYYSCLGENGRLIDEYLDKGDILSAVAQSVAAVRCINVTDTPVFHRFANAIVNEFRLSSFLVDKEGHQYSPDEVIKLMTAPQTGE